MSPSEPAGPFLKLLFRLMKTTLVRKKTQLNDKMTKSKIWQIQKRFVILSFILKRSCYFWRFLEKFSDFLCSNFGTLTTTSKIQMKYVWWQNRMTKSHFFALNPTTRMFEMIYLNHEWFKSWHPTVGKPILENIGKLYSRVGLAQSRPFCKGPARASGCERMRVQQNRGTIL